jgi:hypothetical protein
LIPVRRRSSPTALTLVLTARSTNHAQVNNLHKNWQRSDILNDMQRDQDFWVFTRHYVNAHKNDLYVIMEPKEINDYRAKTQKEWKWNIDPITDEDSAAMCLLLATEDHRFYPGDRFEDGKKRVQRIV